ncbi:unnamed protein product [Blepharisma stoltei]|uniref:Uncharacterized protein n=1 Tax=Blepharisma stoltei TaxID=1481888 RepID=A0AAU9JVV6_9CILI|nr:unnamed protein product [Blepharisma stoltei]
MIASAQYARTIDFCAKYDKAEINTYIELLQASKSNFLTHQNNLLNNYYSWSYCDSSKIVKTSFLSTWDFLNTPKVFYKNLHDEIDLFVENSENLIYNLNRPEDYVDSLQFLISNGFGETFKQVNSSLYGLIDCEKNQIYKLNFTVKLLVIIESALAGTCIIVLIMIVYLISKRYNLLWNFIIQAATVTYFDLVALCIDRLSSVHGVNFNQEYQDAVQKNISKGKKVNFTVSSRYILRLLILFSITIVYYVCVHVYIYPTCEKYLIERPELLATYISRRALTPAIGFWAREAGLQRFGKEFWTLNPYFFSNPEEELDKTLSSFYYLNKQLLQRMQYMSSIVKSNLFEYKNTSTPGFKYGTFWYTNLLFYDAWDLQYDKENFFEASQNLTNSLTQLQQLMTKIYEVIDQTSQNMILEKSNFILYAAVAYVLTIIILYFLYYLPYIEYEMERLSKLQVIISIIPPSIKSEKSPKHYQEASFQITTIK